MNTGDVASKGDDKGQVRQLMEAVIEAAGVEHPEHGEELTRPLMRFADFLVANLDDLPSAIAAMLRLTTAPNKEG